MILKKRVDVLDTVAQNVKIGTTEIANVDFETNDNTPSDFVGNSPAPRKSNRRFLPKLKGLTTHSVAMEKPVYMTKNTSEYDRGAGTLKDGNYTPSIIINMPKNPKNVKDFDGGNLANPNVNKKFFSGRKLATNSPIVFDTNQTVRLIPLGGVSEVGMNMTAIECGDDIIVVDAGMGFGGGELFPGVDYIVPDIDYLVKNKHKIRGLIFTHGHLDHIGGAPYLLPKLGNIPIYGLPLTLALLRNRLQEFALADKIQAKIVDPTQPLILGSMTVHFFKLNHSIPDVCGLAIDTVAGRIVYCTDWKFDNTPFDGNVSDYGKLAELGDGGVRLLLTDSLGALKPGYQISENVIAGTVKKIFSEAEGRVIFTTFSTTIARLQHVVDACVATGRKLAITGRSMLTNFRTCYQMGYIRVPAGLIIDFVEVAKLDSRKVAVLCTGSQGEELAALSKLARDEHQTMQLHGGDAVIFSNSQIPGNETMIQDLVASLSRKGVEVYHPKELDLHVSGHACHEDLKLLFALTKPDYLQPIHGDHFMLQRVADLGKQCGILPEHCLIGENGRITELNATEVIMTDQVITDKCVLIEGTTLGAVSEAVLVERRQMMKGGVVAVVVTLDKARKLIGKPEIVSKGFVFVKNNLAMMDKIQMALIKAFPSFNYDPKNSFYVELKNNIRNCVANEISNLTEKEPVVMPVVVQL